MSRIADLFEIMDSNWCDREVLLANPVADGTQTRAMLRLAHTLGLEVLAEYDLGYHPKGGDYICGVTEPWAYQMQGGSGCVSATIGAPCLNGCA